MRTSALLLPLPLLFLGCTRDTPGFCNADASCAGLQFCLLPAHECTLPTALALLSGSQQVPPTPSEGEGTLRVLIDESSGKLTYFLSHNLASAPKAAHIHAGAPGKSSTAVVFPLLVASGASETLPIDADRIEVLRQGGYYADLHTDDFPDGELRAQIWPLGAGSAALPGIALGTVLSGLTEGPPNPSTARGQATVTLNEATGAISFNATHNLQSPVTGIHIHRGRFNVNGPHIVDLPTSSESPHSGTVGRDQIKPDQAAIYTLLLKSNLAYLNYHTMAFTGGEMRGQLLWTRAVPFYTVLDGKQEVPPVTTTAQGQLACYLNEEHTALTFRLTHTAGGVTEAGIYKPAQGGAPQRVCKLGDGSDKAQGTCTVKLGGAAGDLLADDLLGGKLFVNLLTTQNPGGELRGALVVPQAP